MGWISWGLLGSWFDLLGFLFDLLGECKFGWSLHSRGGDIRTTEVTSNCHSVVRHAASQRHRRHGRPPLPAAPPLTSPEQPYKNSACGEVKVMAATHGNTDSHR